MVRPLRVAMRRRALGRRQVVRQRILIPPYGGSNPPAPATQSAVNRQFRVLVQRPACAGTSANDFGRPDFPRLILEGFCPDLRCGLVGAISNPRNSAFRADQTGSLSGQTGLIGAVYRKRAAMSSPSQQSGPMWFVLSKGKCVRSAAPALLSRRVVRALALTTCAEERGQDQRRSNRRAQCRSRWR